mgnify:CR=1 FL=1
MDNQWPEENAAAIFPAGYEIKARYGNTLPAPLLAVVTLWNGITQYAQFVSEVQPGEMLVVCVKAAAVERGK